MEARDEEKDEFIRQLTAAQSSLWGYVFSLLPDHVAAQDVLQQINLTLWRKADDFQSGTSFFAWASQAAYFHVLTYRRGMRRDRLVFDDEVLAYLAERQAERMTERGPSDRLMALRGCLEKLPPHSRRLLESRYAPGGSVKDLAEADGRSVAALSQVLYRIRDTLLNCIQSSLAAGGAA
ncbi:MAG TPA: sigma-70 family RNA polymerase sigma factor [Planctomycetota bacterium]|nr:sigma-70 family RNA polymerase sigma factor [Planctomycetota bacterium]